MTPDIETDPNAGHLRPSTSGNSTERYAAVLVALAAFLSPIGDFGPTGGAGGVLGAHPSLILAVLAGPLFAYGGRLTTFEKRVYRLGVVVVGWGVTVTLLTIVVLPAQALGESTPIKSVKVAITFAVWLIAIFSCVEAYKRARLYLSVGFGLSLALSMAVLWGFEMISPLTIDSNAILHMTTNIQQRPRILSSESSIAGASLVGCAFAFLLCTRNFQRWAVIVVTSVVLSLTQLDSSGTNVALVAAILVLAIGISARSIIRSSVVFNRFFVCLCAIMALALYLLTQAIASATIAVASDKAVSLATRSAWSLASQQSILQSPWGQGFAAPLFTSQQLLFEAQASLSPIFSPSAWTEVANLVYGGSDRALAPKTLSATLNLYLGIPGLLFWLTLILVLASAGVKMMGDGFSSRSLLLASAPVFAITSTTTYVSGFFELSLIAVISISICVCSQYGQKLAENDRRKRAGSRYAR